MGGRPHAFAGKQVEVSITYATDPFVQELGVFVDDVEVIADGASVAPTSFEDGLGGFTVGGPPEGSGPNEQLDPLGGAVRGVRRDQDA